MKGSKDWIMSNVCSLIRVIPFPPSLPPYAGTAQTAWEKSCYFKIDFKIPEEAMMYEAVQR